MTKIPLFHIGNHVKVTYDEHKDEDAVILKQSHHTGQWSYEVAFLEEGDTLAWIEEPHITFVGDGGEHLFTQAEENRKKASARNTSREYLSEMIDSDVFNSESVLYLFKIAGFQSRFLRSGEFFHLWDEWRVLHHVFGVVKCADSTEQAKMIFTEDGLAKFDVDAVWKFFHEVK